MLNLSGPPGPESLDGRHVRSFIVVNTCGSSQDAPRPNAASQLHDALGR